MRIEKFASMAKEEMEKRTGKSVEIREVLKINNQTRLALTVKDVQGSAIPMIYVEGYHRMYEQLWNWDETMDAMYKVWEDSRMAVEFEKEAFMDFEKVRDRLYYRLVERKLNKKLLMDMPWKGFLDLAKVYYVNMETDVGSGSINVYRNHLEMWGISEKELRETAERNMKNMKVTVNSIKELLQGTAAGETKGLKYAEDCDLSVMSLKGLPYGSSAICQKKPLARFADSVGKDVAILPCSIYEVLLLPMWEDFRSRSVDVESLRQMVSDVNNSMLMPEERLSDSVYLYRRETGKVEIMS